MNRRDLAGGVTEASSGGNAILKPKLRGDRVKRKLSRTTAISSSRRKRRELVTREKKGDQPSYDEKYQVGFHVGFAKGFEDGHKRAYEQQV